MVNINHRIGINALPEKIYEALTTDDGLKKWWTNDISGAGMEGSTIKFRFNGGGPDFTVTKLIPNKTVCWKHSGNIPESWMDTEISFQLETGENQTFVRFTHSNWNETTDFMAHCNTKWAVFLLSLKDALETGKGTPFPNDIQIDHS
ncbi:SRPBCC domain-containing protein [Colwellia sp. MB02u-18]|uniref:SRPBCC family protein n=1 Tax=unclassified Colwellia TaxID=196834 RepID=UPI0015F5007D|nr:MULTISPECIES: SRPBCC domain-containing protein [unclassified Colwellia]MBA6225190.1 SRPBCC domain-containing protein [Colwellia sp. MB3u-45]MBA6266562.1 SRPBCC domain-containing protein [Colwellia sp. MB3u-43]MBA6319607.1 SRPBCC domain-containing protein [Colwellia sp. MB02u-19]MBA6322989.1 SRPBCC domain-containing protein [Colwellia sp. MB02u-18]MBA6329682.1 SRPBCC domain-containing protein [Colwellia sp. MB02u-12]